MPQLITRFQTVTTSMLYPSFPDSVLCGRFTVCVYVYCLLLFKTFSLLYQVIWLLNCKNINICIYLHLLLSHLLPFSSLEGAGMGMAILLVLHRLESLLTVSK